MNHAKACVTLALVLAFVPEAAYALESCPYKTSPSDASAQAWLVQQGKTLRYQADDPYAYLGLSPQAISTRSQPNLGPLFPADSVNECLYGFCVAGAVWSPDNRFIAFAAGNGVGGLSPEILVARVADQVVWRASPTEELLDIASLSPDYRALVGWPAWTSATTLEYTRCADNARFDLIMSVASKHKLILPDWLISGQPAPVVSNDLVAALTHFWAVDPYQYALGDPAASELRPNLVSIAAEPRSGTVFVSAEDVAGTIGPSGRLERWTLQPPSQRRYSLRAFVTPYSMTSGTDGEIYVTTNPHNLFEWSRLYGISASGTSTPFASYDWNPAALAYDDARHVIYAADPFANAIYRVKKGATPVRFAGKCEALTDGSVSTGLSQLCRGGNVDGQGDAARFHQPGGLAYDPDNSVLYVADTGNNEIRGIRKDGTVFTLAGSCVRLGDDQNCIGMLADGRGKKARFFYPMGITYDPVSGALFVADAYNQAIRRVSLEGEVTTLAVDKGKATGAGPNTTIAFPAAITYDARSQTLLVINRGDDSLRRVTRDGHVSTVLKPLF